MLYIPADGDLLMRASGRAWCDSVLPTSMTKLQRRCLTLLISSGPKCPRSHCWPILGPRLSATAKQRLCHRTAKAPGKDRYDVSSDDITTIHRDCERSDQVGPAQTCMECERDESWMPQEDIPTRSYRRDQYKTWIRDHA
jgi:hypothetical protein